MKIQTRRIIALLAALCAIVYNLLCLFEVFPQEKWTLSLVLTVPVLLWALPAAGRAGTKRAESPADRKRKGIVLVLASAWLITVLACIVYPL